MNHRDLFQVVSAKLKALIFPSDPIAAFRGVFVALSLLALYKHASSHEFSHTLELFVETYDAVLSKLFSPFQPVLNEFSVQISAFFQVELTVQGYWKHIFVLLSLYFFSRSAGAYSAKRYGTAIFRLLWGSTVALAFSIGASLEGEYAYSISREFRVALSAVGCIAVYELGVNIWFATFFREAQALLHQRQVRTWWSEFGNLSKEDGVRFVVGVSMVIALLSIPWPGFITRPDLFSIAIVALVHGVFWVFWGWRQTRFEQQLALRLDAARSNGDVLVGMAMIRSFFYAIIAVTVDVAAGLL